MFNTLASPASARDRRLALSGTLALFAHVTLGAAVWGSLRRAPAPDTAPVPVVIDWPRPPEQGPRSGAPAPGLPGPSFDVPTLPAPGSPPFGVGAPPDPELWIRAAPTGAPRGIARSDPSAMWLAADVEEQPVLLAGRPPAYPESLRRAGIGGRVVVEAVIDSAGQVEPGSVRVIASPDRGFDAAAQGYVSRALFRPARVHGRAVRVLVRVPIDFTLAGAR